MRKLRLGVVGCGAVVEHGYVPALDRLPNFQVAAAADPDPARRGLAARWWPDSRIFEDVATLIRACSVDALVIANPPAAHLSAWDSAARAGLPVLVEKPLLAPRQLSRLDQIPRDARGRLMIDFNRRWWPPYRHLVDAARGDAFGTLREVEVVLHADLAQWSKINAHRLDPLQGGVLYDLGSQAFDLVHRLCRQRLVEVGTKACDNDSRHPVISVDGITDGGVSVHCELGYGRRWCERIALRGSLAAVFLPHPYTEYRVVGQSWNSRWRSWRSGARYSGWALVSRAQRLLPYTVRAALVQFEEAVRGRAAFSPGFDEALAVAHALEAAQLSLEIGAPVKTGGVAA